jgi:hypothetical protein
MNNSWYVLDGKIPRPAKDMDEFFNFSDPSKFEQLKRVGNTQISIDVAVSTVFLGIDHNWGFRNEERPILFETMVFGGEHAGYQDRYCTWEEAEIGHARIVAFISKSEGPGKGRIR